MFSDCKAELLNGIDDIVPLFLISPEQNLLDITPTHINDTQHERK
jgi:hypothetical protein